MVSGQLTEKTSRRRRRHQQLGPLGATRFSGRYFTFVEPAAPIYPEDVHQFIDRREMRAGEVSQTLTGTASAWTVRLWTRDLRRHPPWR